MLVACEFSGRVRDAFEDEGWDAWSCDLLPTESEQTRLAGKHVQGDVMEILHEGWLLVIAHPPCTYLSYAGGAHWKAPGRLEKRLEALEFFARLWLAPVPHICIENPRGCASPTIAKYSQVVQPYEFGDPYLKTTWLWLKNLPPLRVEEGMAVPPVGYWVDSNSRSKVKRFPQGEYFKGLNKSHERSITFNGIARAMARQWTEYITLT
jgi:hypothetical protein